MKFLLSLTLFISSTAWATLPEYEVPVPAELAPYSRFAMNEVRYVRQGQRLKISYELPLELTGIKNQLKFEGAIGADGISRLEGSSGTMQCVDEAGIETCQVHYWAIRQDFSAVKRLLKSKRYSEEVLRGKLAVARYFGGVRESFSLLDLLISPAHAARGGEMEGFIRFRISENQFY